MQLQDTIHRHFFRNLLYTLLLLFIILFSGLMIGSDLGEVVSNSRQAQLFLSQFLQPDWEYFPRLVEPMLKTIAMSIAATFLGGLLAVPTAFLGTQVVTRNSFITIIFRVTFSLIRTIPNLLLAAIFVAIVGIGEFTGVLTIAVFTFGMVSQLVFGAIETTEYGPIEANESIGATRFQIALTAVWPQINHSVWQYILYAFEVNIRASAVLGYVGAGGIGVTLNTALGFRQYGRVSLIILFILAVVVIIDLVSGYIRKEVI